VNILGSNNTISWVSVIDDDETWSSMIHSFFPS